MMQSVKGTFQYKFDRFDVTLNPFSDKKLDLSVLDPVTKMEFHDKMLTLTNIGTATLMKALEKKLIEVKMDMKVNETPEGPTLQINVLVASQFLRPVEELIVLKKARDVSESEVLKKAIDMLATKIKLFNEN